MSHNLSNTISTKFGNAYCQENWLDKYTKYGSCCYLVELYQTFRFYISHTLTLTNSMAYGTREFNAALTRSHTFSNIKSKNQEID